MAAPSPTTRATPSGRKLDDGYQALITFAADTDVSFWEKTVQPPGIDGGDAIETTTMHNSTYRTMAARALKTLTQSALTVAYDPKVYPQIVALCNVETTITVKFSDGSTLAFYGYLRTFEPDSMEEGSQPEATINISPTNVDPSSGAEAGPVYTAGTGT